MSTPTTPPADDEIGPAPAPQATAPADAAVTGTRNQSPHDDAVPEHDSAAQALMVALLDTPGLRTPRTVTEPMRSASVGMVRVQIGRLLAQMWDWLRGARPHHGYLLGDAVSCVPYGDGVIVAVSEDGATYLVATQQYGDVRIDPRRDLMMPREDKRTQTIDN
jgi:hypothetical protein